jgi:bifunctional non-homologous end joining protein LigD
MRLRLVKEPFDHPDYIFELKHDGFRAIVYLQNGECKLISRNLKNLRFDPLKKALAKLRVQSAIIDGEIVTLDKNGVSQFYQLLSGKAEPIFYAFDLLWIDGKDLRNQPLIERKKRLAGLVKSSGCKRLFYAQHIEREGKRFFAEICSRDLEGVVAKRRLGIYKEDATGWLKIKNRPYSQAKGRHELLTRGKGSLVKSPR